MAATGRPPKHRDNYIADAQYLLILTRAINSDLGLPVDWRKRVTDLLKAASRELINAPEKIGSQIGQTSQSKKARVKKSG